ncbi:MAG: hypothetical protein ABII85_01055 [Bacillota bacterium]
MIDPIRYQKEVGNLSDDQIEVMSNRTTHFFIPKKRKYNDYNCTYFLDSIINIKRQWKEDFKPLVDNAVKKIQVKNMLHVMIIILCLESQDLVQQMQDHNG